MATVNYNVYERWAAHAQQLGYRIQMIRRRKVLVRYLAYKVVDANPVNDECVGGYNLEAKFGYLECLDWQVRTLS